MSEVVIYHNNRCGTSMNTLMMIRDAGIEPRVVEYMKNPPSRETLRELAGRMGVPIRGLLREKERIYAEQDLGNPKWSDEELLGQIEQNPVLLNRPIVVTERGAALCRPADKVLELLPVAPAA
ncbi:MAG: arsenate reductase (glutaredoxin) [Burkholderiaceae bacterium]